MPPGAGEDSEHSTLLERWFEPHEKRLFIKPRRLAIRQGPWKQIFHRDGRRELFDPQGDTGRRVTPAYREVKSLLLTAPCRATSTGVAAPGPAQKNEFDLELWDDRRAGKEDRRRKRKKSNKKN